MTRALALAAQAREIDEVPIGALLTVGDEILAEGYNLRERSQRTCSHAELEALESYNKKSNSWRLPPNTTLYVTVEPCLMCTGALLWARLDHLVYGCADTKNAGLERVASLIESGVFDHRFKSTTRGVLAAECSDAISSYFRAKRQTQP